MKEVNLFLVRRCYSDGDCGSYKLYMLEDGEDIEEELLKLLPKKSASEVRHICEASDMPLDEYNNLRVMSNFDYSHVDSDSLARLVLR